MKFPNLEWKSVAIGKKIVQMPDSVAARIGVFAEELEILRASSQLTSQLAKGGAEKAVAGSTAGNEKNVVLLTTTVRSFSHSTADSTHKVPGKENKLLGRFGVTLLADDIVELGVPVGVNPEETGGTSNVVDDTLPVTDSIDGEASWSRNVMDASPPSDAVI